ncbi:hypothetical protein IT568_11505 [bacterium]|nr:hypothetical protein [bacterium]
MNFFNRLFFIFLFSSILLAQEKTDFKEVALDSLEEVTALDSLLNGSHKSIENLDLEINPYNDYINLLSAIHLDSKISGGDYMPNELAELLVDNKLDVGIITDHDQMRVEYGIPFLRKLAFFREKNSISKYGEEKYVSTINTLDNYFGNLILMHGVEAIPFYYWEIDWETLTFTIRNFHKHLLVFGLKTAEDYENIPSLKNGFPNKKFSFWSLLNIIPLIGLWYGVRLYRTVITTQVLKFGKIHDRKRQFKIPGALIFIFSVLILYNNFPFVYYEKYNQYEGDLGTAPYQELIDYVNAKGGMVFYAHPEKNSTIELGSFLGFKAQMITDEYYTDLNEVKGWKGFAAFWEGDKHTASIGGVWDKNLMKFCNGILKEPVWALSELDYDGGDFIRESLTQIFVKDKNPESVIEALRNGRMVFSRDFAQDYLVFKEFSVKDGKEFGAIIGETLVLQKGELPTIKIKVDFPKKKKEKYTLHLIKNGIEILQYPLEETNKIEFVEKDYSPRQKSYYRIIISKGRNKFFVFMTNPIFVETK